MSGVGVCDDVESVCCIMLVEFVFVGVADPDAAIFVSTTLAFGVGVADPVLILGFSLIVLIYMLNCILYYIKFANKKLILVYASAHE
jgi:hypothetical protein